MSVYDRDYMRSGKRPSWGGTGSWTIRILIALAVVFFLQNALGGMTEALMVSWPAVAAGRIWTPFTAAFLHADGNHLIGNLIGVYIFGRMAEEALGSERFLRFSLITAVAAHVPFVLFQAFGADPRPSLGYSGVVLAYVMVAAFRYPHAKILLFFVLPTPMWLLGALYVMGDLTGVLGQYRGDGVGINHMVHLTGAACGYWAHLNGGIDLPFRLPKLSGKGPRRAGPPPPSRREPRDSGVQEEVDRLLDKISQEGIGSLTPKERAFLEEASKRYR